MNLDYEAHIIELGNTNLILLKASKGYVMCGLLDIDVAQKLGHAAAMVTGVTSEQDALNAKIIKVTENAKKLGITAGMTGLNALKLME